MMQDKNLVKLLLHESQKGAVKSEENFTQNTKTMRKYWRGGEQRIGEK